MRRALRLLAGAAALALISSHAPAQDRDALIAAAKREGSVTVYEGFPSAALQAAMTRSFQEKYGIRVDLLMLRSSELAERLRAEQTAGRYIADVLNQGESSFTLQIGAARVALLPPIENAANLLPGMEALAHRAPSFVAPYAIMTNTNLVKPEDEPNSWLDLLDAKWKGKLLADDPRAAGGGGAFMAVTNALFGEDYHRRLAANAPSFTRDPGAAERRVAAGEYAMLYPAIASDMPNLRGLPVKFLAPREGVPSIRMDIGVLARAPRPNAARLFIEHMLSDEFQATIARIGFLPVTRGAASHLPAELRPFAQVKLLGGTTPEDQQRILRLATEIYK